LTYFSSESEEIRSGAAFAAGELCVDLSGFGLIRSGNVAVGSPNVFLPAILQGINSATDETSSMLMLHAMKEVSDPHYNKSLSRTGYSSLSIQPTGELGGLALEAAAG
jgi:hypothetical protein